MERVTDWATLWRQLVERRPEWNRANGDAMAGPSGDPWRDRAHDFDSHVKRRSAGPDIIRDFLASRVGASTTVLDIGAGTGHWALFLAPLVRQVTALEPSPSMLAILREHLAETGVRNVDVVEGSWPDESVEPHDVSLCSHAMYSSPDLPGFVQKMVAVTRRTCHLLIRKPDPDGVMAEAATHLWGQPHDSPNFVVAYNVLLQMGLFPNVLVDTVFREPWVHPTLEAALAELKRRLGVEDETEHDAFLGDLLRRRLAPGDSVFVWPDRVRSALVYWDIRTPGS